MTPKRFLGREIMQRVEAIRLEMAAAVRELGGAGCAKDQNREAAKATGLHVSLIERLRWKKIRRIPGDIVDVVRESIAERQAKIDQRSNDELATIAARLQALEARLEATDPEFFGAEAIPAIQSAYRFGSSVPGMGTVAGPERGETQSRAGGERR